MGSVNTVPVVSQVKSAVQAISGDLEGARETQLQFVHQCPVASQVTSVVYLAQGNKEKFVDTNKQCVKSLSNMADGIPVVGHVKGTIHYIAGDKEGGDNAMKSASRTTGVIAGGVGGNPKTYFKYNFVSGFFVAGPPGAVLGGIAGGAAMDGVTSVVDTIVHDEPRPSGFIAAIDRMADKPSAGAVFDLVMVPVADGVTGYAAGQVTSKIQTSIAKAKTNSVGNTLPTKSSLAERTAVSETRTGASAKPNSSVSSVTSSARKGVSVKPKTAQAGFGMREVNVSASKTATNNVSPPPKVEIASSTVPSSGAAAEANAAPSGTSAYDGAITSAKISGAVTIGKAAIKTCPVCLKGVATIVKEFKSDGKCSNCKNKKKEQEKEE